MPAIDSIEPFERQGAENYDNYNQHLEPITESLHFLNRLILKGLPAEAEILCLGVGTGADILYLAKDRPKWRFTGIDPSPKMLEGCRKKLESYGLNDRCSLFNGFLSDFQTSKRFDAILCIFVMHFVDDLAERRSMFEQMASLLKPNSHLILTEISADMETTTFPEELETWKNMHEYAGMPQDRLDTMDQILKSSLKVLSPIQTEGMIISSGFSKPIQFFQSLLMRGWFAKKN